MRETKDLNKCIYIPCSWFGRLIIVKLSILSILVYRNQSATQTCQGVVSVTCHLSRFDFSILKLSSSTITLVPTYSKRSLDALPSSQEKTRALYYKYVSLYPPNDLWQNWYMPFQRTANLLLILNLMVQLYKTSTFTKLNHWSVNSLVHVTENNKWNQKWNH